MSTLTGGPGLITNGLVLYLDAANPSSYTSGSLNWNDLSRSQLSGSLINGPTFNTGSGGSIVFDGVNDYVNIAQNSLYSLTSNFTFSCWVRVAVTPGFTVGIFGTFDDNNGTGSPFMGWGFWLFASTGLTYFTLMTGNGNSAYSTLKSNNTYTLNTWYNLTGISTGSITYLYVNGVQQTQTLSTTIIAPTSGSVIGRAYPSTNNYYLSGSVATTQIYNRALSADEVLQNYNATKTRFGL